MTITSIGYERAISYAELGVLLAHAGTMYSVFQQDAFAVAAGAGTREVTVQPGRAYGWGVLDDSDTVETLTGAAVDAGSRWDLVVLRRTWTGETPGSSLVLIQGGPTAVIPSRSTDPGDEDDQPLALVRFAAGQTAVQEFIDLRCWGGDGAGFVARHKLALDYLTRIGSRVRIQGVTWVLAYDTATPAWVPESPYVGSTQPPYADNLVWVKVP